MKVLRHILFLTACLAALLLAGCSLHSHQDNGQPYLTLYVYMPDQPLLTRADQGPVAGLADESKVTQLQAWVFLNHPYTDIHGETHSTGERIAYLNTSVDADWTGSVYQLPVSDEFAAAVNDLVESNRPTVDVYVLANAASVGVDYDETATTTQLNAIQFDNSYFGTATIVTQVPSDGLPMSGVLKNQPVYGTQPVLRIGTESNIATVALVRAVSKIRFVFSRIYDEDHPENYPDIVIDRVTLDGGKLPVRQYVFLNDAWSLNGNRYKVNQNNYVADEFPLVVGTQEAPIAIGKTADKEEVLSYKWNGQTAQEYENLVDAGITANKLKQSGPFYLHESDRQLTGKIYYTVGEGETQTASFSMAAAGDFGRNHTWIVYGFFNDGDLLEVIAVYLKDWEENVSANANDELYNW